MKRTPGDKPPIVRISQFSIQASTSGRGKRYRIGPQRWTVYGIDAEGVERVYADHTTEEEHEAWLATDPLWREAQRAVVERLLGDPQTRDMVLRMAMGAALDRGDMDTVAALARRLSPETLRKLPAGDGTTVEADRVVPGQ